MHVALFVVHAGLLMISIRLESSGGSTRSSASSVVMYVMSCDDIGVFSDNHRTVGIYMDNHFFRKSN